MFEAQVGDDVYGEDPTVKGCIIIFIFNLFIKIILMFFLLLIFTELELKGASMLGKEAALFVPSGTMSNLLACE